MFAWNFTGLITAFLTILVAIACYIGLASLFGETERIKYVAFAIGGVLLIAADLILRNRFRDQLGRARFFDVDAGGTLVVFPLWTLGVLWLATSIGFLVVAK